MRQSIERVPMRLTGFWVPWCRRHSRSGSACESARRPARGPVERGAPWALAHEIVLLPTVDSPLSTPLVVYAETAKYHVPAERPVTV